MKTVIGQFNASPESARGWAQIVAFAPFMFQVARSLKNLGVLEHLSRQESSSFASLKEATSLSDYSLEVLLDAGESCGLVENIDDQKRFQITPSGRFLAEDALTNANLNFTADVCYQGLTKLEESLRNEVPAGLKTFGNWNTIYEGLMELPPQALKSWLEFDHYFSSDAFPKVIPMILADRPKTILDVGGNTGKFAVGCCLHDPNVQVTILDHPSQLAKARDRAESAGVLDRINFVEMNLLDHSKPLPMDFEVIWMSQFLDCFAKEDILQLFKRTRAAMNSGSIFYIMEPFIDRQKYEAGRFCLDMTSLYFTCMANGNSRMYRYSDFKELLDAAELKIESEQSARLSQTLLKCKLA